MQNKIFIIFFIIFDIVSAYELLAKFPTFVSSVFGFSLCLFFINILLIFWTKYLIKQPEEAQKEIILPVMGKEGIVNYSLYEILHNSWSKMKKLQLLYGEILFSLFVLLFLTLIITQSIMLDGSSITNELRNVFSFTLLPYYSGFCLSSITIITAALIQNKKNGVLGQLRVEFMIKLLQTIFITTFYKSGGPAFLLIAFISFVRMLNSKSTPEVVPTTQEGNTL